MNAKNMVGPLSCQPESKPDIWYTISWTISHSYFFLDLLWKRTFRNKRHRNFIGFICMLIASHDQQSTEWMNAEALILNWKINQLVRSILLPIPDSCRNKTATSLTILTNVQSSEWAKSNHVPRYAVWRLSAIRQQSYQTWQSHVPASSLHRILCPFLSVSLTALGGLPSCAGAVPVSPCAQTLWQSLPASFPPLSATNLQHTYGLVRFVIYGLYGQFVTIFFAFIVIYDPIIIT